MRYQAALFTEYVPLGTDAYITDSDSRRKSFN